MGHLLGNAVRLGPPGDGVVRDAMAAGEGIAMVLSLRCAPSCLPLAAALSAGHLAALLFRPGLRRLYLIRARRKSFKKLDGSYPPSRGGGGSHRAFFCPMRHRSFAEGAVSTDFVERQKTDLLRS